MQHVIYFSNWLKKKESKNVKANMNKYLTVGGFFFLIRKIIFSGVAFDLTLKIYNTLRQKNREAATKLND